MHNVVRIRLRWLIPISLLTYFFLVLVVYYYLAAISFEVYPGTAYPPHFVDYHDLGNSILTVFQPNGYVRFEYVFDKPVYRGWVIYPYIDRVDQYWEPGKVNISIYAVDVAPSLVASYVLWPGYEGYTTPPSDSLIVSDYGVREIRITRYHEGIEVAIS